MKWVVVKEQQNRYEFSKFHASLEEAKDEAERLCRKEGKQFLILELKYRCYIDWQLAPVILEEIEP